MNVRILELARRELNGDFLVEVLATMARAS